jgi:hypothetical protein
MELSALYYRKNALRIDERVVFPLEAESAKTAWDTFFAALTVAVVEHRPDFCLWGQRFVTEDFTGSLPETEFNRRHRRGRPEDIYPPTIHTSQDGADRNVHYLISGPVFRTIREWLADEREEQRPLTWVEAGEDYVRFLDELWGLDVRFPAVPAEGGMRVEAPHGAPVILKPESKYFVEGWTDNLRIAVECNNLLIRATDDGFMLCSTDEWCFTG